MKKALVRLDGKPAKQMRVIAQVPNPIPGDEITVTDGHPVKVLIERIVFVGNSKILEAVSL